MSGAPPLLRGLLSGAAAIAIAAAVPRPAIAAAAATSATSVNSTNVSSISTAPPTGFQDLEQPREVLVDVYFGGRKIGSAVAVAKPGFLQFRDPLSVARLVPNLSSPQDLSRSLSGDLPAHAALVCSQANRQDCGALPADTAGIIYDEGRFRADLFVPPAMLHAIPPTDTTYLEVTGGPASLSSVIGLAISGADGQPTTYNVQNRTIAAVGAGRVRSDLSYSSGLGTLVDDLVAEYDTHKFRYSGGLFWAPGLDLTGRRRIAGVGFGSQFDTRADRETMTGTPLILFLSQPARVEFLVDGRLVASRSYDAGKNILDTSSLPEGSYPVVLRIREASGAEREERRFFVKTPQVAPVGQPLYFAYAGFLANSSYSRPISLSDTFYYQAGTARRLSQNFAVDLSLVGTQKKVMAEAGMWFLNPVAQLRAAALISTESDKAILLQANSSGQRRWSFAFDLRRVWSHDGLPLIPLPAFIDSFDQSEPTNAQIGGSYVQASGSLGYRIGTAYLGLTGSLRKDDGRQSDYSYGPSLTWPVLSRGGLLVMVQADAQRTRTTNAAFAGIRVQLSGKRLSLISSGGYGTTDSRDGSTQSSGRAIGSLSGSYFHESEDRAQLQATAGVERSVETSVAHAGATVYGRYGNARVDVLDTLEGVGKFQYGLSLQSAIAVSGGDIGLGARDLDDGAIIVKVDGKSEGTSFGVFVNGFRYGRVTSGGELPIHLQPYYSYKVWLRPDDAAAVSFDSDSKTVTLYPGTVRTLRWAAVSVFTAFGQAFGADGKPVANATIQAPHSVGETDENGYFQIDAADGDSLLFSKGGAECRLSITGVTPRNDFASLGKVQCK